MMAERKLSAIFYLKLLGFAQAGSEEPFDFA